MNKSFIKTLFLVLCFTQNLNAMANQMPDQVRGQITFQDIKNISYASSKLFVLLLLELKNSDLIDNTTIIFIHIPKTGGTSLLQAIEPQKKIDSKRFCVPRVEDVSPSLITQNWLGGYSNLEADCSGNINCNQYRLINGHFSYGVHQFVENRYRYITLVRSPLEREISSLNFDFQRGFIKKNDAYKYLLKTTLDNPQVRMLAGKQYMSGTCDEQTLEIAKANIEKDFLLVGVTEDTNSFIQTMLTLFELAPVASTKAQVTGEKIFEKVPDDLLPKLKEKHKYDLALYEYALAKWHEWKQQNILGFKPLSNQEKILTLMPNYMADSKAKFMTLKQIEQNNKLYNDQALTKVIED